MLYPNSDSFASVFPAQAPTGQHHLLQQLLALQSGAQAQPFGGQPQSSGIQPPLFGMQPQMFGQQPQMFGQQPQLAGMQAQLFGLPPGQPLGNHTRVSGLQSLHQIAQSLQALAQHLTQFAVQQFALQQHALQQLAGHQLGNAPFANGLAVH